MTRITITTIANVKKVLSTVATPFARAITQQGSASRQTTQGLREHGAFYIGYPDFARLYTLHQAGSFFVIRAKPHLNAYSVSSAATDWNTPIRHPVLRRGRIGVTLTLAYTPDPLVKTGRTGAAIWLMRRSPESVQDISSPAKR